MREFDEKELDAEIHQALQNARRQSEEASRCLETLLKTSRPSNPVFHGAGCGVAIGAFILFVIVWVYTGSGNAGFALGVLSYFAVACLFYILPTKQLHTLWAQILRLERTALTSLNKAFDLSAALRKRNLVAVTNRHAKIREAKGLDEFARREQLEARLRPIALKLAAQANELGRVQGWACLAWDDPRWAGWDSPSGWTFCAAFGVHQPIISAISDVAEAFTKLPLDFHVPAFFPFDTGRGLLVHASPSAKKDAAGMVQGFAVRLLSVLPPGKAKFTCFDPIGLGNNVANLMSLADDDETLVNSRAWSEPLHIEQRLAEITEHMETVIQKYLRQDYKTIHDYNEHAGEVAEPHRFVVVFDFPANFTETAARRLVSVAQNGSRCGVYPIILVDTSKPLPYGFSLAELERHKAPCISFGVLISR